MHNPFRYITIIMMAIYMIVSPSDVFAKSIKKLESIASKAKTFEQFLADENILQDYEKALIEYYGTKHFNCQTFPQVISELRSLIKQVPELAHSIWRYWDNRNSVLILSKDGNAYNFQSVPRKLHTIWSYTAERQCNNSTCDSLLDGKKSTILLGRWASILAGSEVHLVEKNGRFSGSAVLVTPYQKEGDVYAMIDAYGNRTTLTNQIKVRDLETRKITHTTLLSGWLDRINSVKPDWLAGYLVASSKNSSLTQAFSPMRLREEKEESLLPMDSASKKLAAHLSKSCQFCFGKE